MPIYYVNGNHDAAQDIKRYLPMGPRQELTADPDLLSYAFELKGYRFLVLDARGPREIDPQGFLSAEQMEIVHHEAHSGGPPLVIVHSLSDAAIVFALDGPQHADREWR